MRCIEMRETEDADQGVWTINFNMRCIEMTGQSVQ